MDEGSDFGVSHHDGEEDKTNHEEHNEDEGAAAASFVCDAGTCMPCQEVKLLLIKVFTLYYGSLEIGGGGMPVMISNQLLHVWRCGGLHRTIGVYEGVMESLHTLQYSYAYIDHA